MKNRFSPLTLKVFVVAAVIGLGACELPKRPADYREAHPIGVQPETRTLSISARIEAEALTPEDQFAFDSFVRDFHLKASGPLGIQVPANGASGIERKARIEKMTDLLVSAGVDRRVVRELPPQSAGPGSLTASFATSTVSVPECGEWSAESGYNWANRRSPNFGCSVQRNLGLTVANPNDLKKAQPAEPYDGNRGASVIETFRTPATATEETTATTTTTE